MLMNILLVGNGGREHALAWKIKQSTPQAKLFSAGTNAGILSLADYVQLDENNFTEIAKFCTTQKIDLVVVGPEAPLARGLVNELKKERIPVFGPTKEAARIESSKSFAKEFMIRHNIPTASFASFDSSQETKAMEYISMLNPPIVVKADGLAAGKGVVICNSHDEAQSTVKSMFSGIFKEAGKKVVIEEYLEGDEASILALTDGSDYIILPTAQDHKRIFDNDQGKNTGGMGSYAPTPLISNDLIAEIEASIIRPAIKGMADEGYPFAGCLYAGLMIHQNKPKVVEFNCRFGDPETQAVLPLLQGDFSSLLYSIAEGKLNKSYYAGYENKYACCVILASKGYPDSFEKGFEITGIENAENSGCIVFHSGTKKFNGKIVTDGGRVLGVVGISPSLEASIAKAYEGAKLINFQNKYYRTDIGKKGLRYIK